jgi:putative Ig domain-containing protein
VTDGRQSASQTVTWTILMKNKAPYITRPPAQKNFEHDTVFFQLAGADPDWDPITFSATGLPPGVVVEKDGTVQGHIPLGSAGTYLVTAKISDGRKSATTTFYWTVLKQ